MANWASFGGFAQGLASSPLGNLPQLMIQREQLQNARQDREQKKKYETGLQTLIEKGDWGGAETLALSQRDYPAANAMRQSREESEREEFQTIYTADQSPDKSGAYEWSAGRGRMDLFQQAWGMDHERRAAVAGLAATEGQEARARAMHDPNVAQARASVAATRAGTAATQQGTQQKGAAFQTELGRQRVALDREQTAAREARLAHESNLRQSAAGRLAAIPKNNLTTASVTRAIKSMPPAERAVLERRIGLGDGRKLVGAQIVTDPQGRKWISATVENPNTGTTGPQTRNATGRPDDVVERMPLDSWMAEMGALSKGKQEWNYKDGIMYNEKDGTYRVIGTTVKPGDVPARTRKNIDNAFPKGEGFSFNNEMDRKRAIAATAVYDAMDMHLEFTDRDEHRIVALVANILSSENPLSKALMNPQSEQEYESAVQELYFELGILAPQDMAQSGLAGAPPPPPPAQQAPLPTMPRPPQQGLNAAGGIFH